MPERFTRHIIVDTGISHVYDLWTQFENFPRFMHFIKSVTRRDGGMTHWVMAGPLGKDIEWDSRTTALEENRRVAWQSTEGDIETGGEVTFKEKGPDRTGVTLTIEYKPKAGLGGELGGKLFKGEVRQRAEEDLRNFKEYAETGAQWAATRQRNQG